MEVVVEAIDAKEKIVGSVSSGGSINPATGGVRIKPGAALAIGLKMDDEFSGTFTVRVLDASNVGSLGRAQTKDGVRRMTIRTRSTRSSTRSSPVKSSARTCYSK